MRKIDIVKSIMHKKQQIQQYEKEYLIELDVKQVANIIDKEGKRIR